MFIPWDKEKEPVWQWLFEKWQFSVPEDSIAVTNIDALRGKKVTEAVRREEDN